MEIPAAAIPTVLPENTFIIKTAIDALTAPSENANEGVKVTNK